MFCSQCGKEIIKEARFCAYCGKEVESAPSIETIQLRCKSCNGVLTVEEGRKVLSCPFCQSKELIVESEGVVKQRIQSEAYKDVETVKQDTYREVELEKQKANKEIEQIRQQASRDIEQIRQKVYRDVEMAKAKQKKVSDPYMNTIKVTLLGTLFVILFFLGMMGAMDLGDDSSAATAIGMVASVLLFLGIGLIISALIRRMKLNKKHYDY